MTNVVKFPSNYKPEETLSDVQEKIDMAKEKYVNGLVDHHCSQLLANISLSGIEIETDAFMKDFAFTVETIRSAMYRSMRLSHPLQEQIDEAIELVDTEEDEDFSDERMLRWDEDDDDDEQ
tara:strand:+ start:106 stop:468 length:363 start_codon:yes stop_codon:yes gene_type:complete